MHDDTQKLVQSGSGSGRLWHQLALVGSGLDLSPKHPQGVRGVGEVPLVPTLAAIRNAVYNALGKRFYSLPMSPPKVLEALNATE